MSNRRAQDINIRAFDYRAGGTLPVVGTLSIPLSPYCEWMTSESFKPSNLPRVPAVQLYDELSEASEDDEEIVRHNHPHYSPRSYV